MFGLKHRWDIAPNVPNHAIDAAIPFVLPELFVGINSLLVVPVQVRCITDMRQCMQASSREWHHRKKRAVHYRDTETVERVGHLHERHFGNFLFQPGTDTGKVPFELVETAIGAVEYITTGEQLLYPVLRLRHNLQWGLRAF
ncbi:hypothetical protein D3C76_933170 [compost metagenome]